MDGSVLSSELASKSFIQVFDDIVAERNSVLELEKILIYMLDTVDDSALPYLAAQFDLLGVKGWNPSTTEQNQRDIIKRAVELHRFKGTPFSIRRALQSVGYYGITFQEGIGAKYDGTFRHNGAITYGGGGWAAFNAIVDLGDGKGINPKDTQELLDIIEEYKPVRSRLVTLSYQTTIIETVFIDEELALDVDMISSETVDAQSEDLALVLEQAAINETNPDTVDGGINLKVLNSLGVELNDYNF